MYIHRRARLASEHPVEIRTITRVVGAHDQSRCLPHGGGCRDMQLMSFRQLSPRKPARMKTRLMGPHIHNETGVTNHIDLSRASLASPPDTCASCATCTKLDYCRDNILHYLFGDDTRVQRQEKSPTDGTDQKTGTTCMLFLKDRLFHFCTT